MSAFIVADRTINRIVAFLGDKYRQDQIGARYAKPITDLGYMILFGSGYPEDEEVRQPECERLARDLADMNTRAVNARYAASHGPDDSPPYVYRREAPPTEIEAYKRLSCLWYQCSEGDVPDEPLYKALDECLARLAEHIVHNSPEFDAADGWE